MLNCKQQFQYGHTVDSSKMEKIQLKADYDDGTSAKKNTCALAPFSTVEDILFCIEDFKRKADALSMDAEDKFDKFGDILKGHDFDNYSSARADGQENDENDFLDCLDRFILKYVDDDARSAQIKHFVHCPEEHSKPLKLTVCEHAARLDATVTRIHPLPPRNGDTIEIQQQKKTLLASCPAAWTGALMMPI